MSPRGRGTKRALALALVVAALAAGPIAAPAASRTAGNGRSATAARLDARGADTLLARGGGHLRELEKWAAGAPLADLVWMLRRPAAELGGSEAVLARAALAHVSGDRAGLRARLVALAGPDAKGKRVAAAPPPRPGASAFRVAAILPDSGDYADYARAVAVGLEAGLQSVPLEGRSIDLEFWGSGDDQPARVAAALETASARSGVLVGELLSVNTLALATGARMLGLPLVSPTATDEAVGTVGPRVFQIGPSGWSRGERLARAVITRPGLHVGALASGDPERDAFTLGFLATAQALGASADWKSSYSPNSAFRAEVQQVATRKLDVLLWDGEPREAEALLRELSRQKVSLQLCGGEALAPERLHADARILIEGARYVAEDWRLADAEQARLDSVLVARGAGGSTPLYVRGWLAGRAIASAVAGGALCPEEVADALGRQRGSAPWLLSHRFLDVAKDGALLPLFTVQRGRGVREAQ